MLNRLFEFLSGTKSAEGTIAAQKFERFRHACSEKPVVTINELVDAPSELMLVDHWHPRTAVKEVAPRAEYEPCVTYPPESLLEVGTAEGFLNCKMPPLDDFKLKRKRTMQAAKLSCGIIRPAHKKSA
jgi:hypothetical protein